MKRFLQTLLPVLALMAGAMPASAKVGTKNLTEELKLHRSCYQYVVTGAGRTHGINGVVAVAALNGVTTFSVTGANATLPYPAKLNVTIQDGGPTADVVVCTSVTITGRDQFGGALSETLTTHTESSTVTTTNAFSVVTKWTGACGATGASDVLDIIRLAVNPEVGLGLKINDASDVESACITDSDGSSDVQCAALDDGTTDDIASALEIASHTLDASTAMFGQGGKQAAADGDTLCFTVRPSYY